MPLLLANWRLILLGLLIASTALFYKLWREDVRAFNAYKIEVAALGKAAGAEKARVQADHDRTTKEIKDAIPKQIAAARAGALRNYLARMPDNPCSGGLPGVADSTAGADAAGKESVVACRSGFIQDCASDALQVGQFQDWVRRIGFPVR